METIFRIKFKIQFSFIKKQCFLMQVNSEKTPSVLLDRDNRLK